jgi:AcrR family transcriptional regulator
MGRCNHLFHKAGIARQTFYRNYDSKEDVLYEYAGKSMDTDLLSIERNPVPNKQDKIVLSFNYAYVIKYRTGTC